MQERLGLDGQRLDRTRWGDNKWIALSSGLLNAEIEYGPPPVLHRLTYYQRDAGGQLTEVDMAAVARRLPGTNSWLMRDGRFWKSEEKPHPALELGSSTGETMIPFRERTVALELDPLWLHYFRMEPQYLPLAVLRALSRTDTGPESKGLYRTRVQILYGEAVLPGAMALLAASLSMLFLAYGTPIGPLVAIAFAGYMAHFGTKACLLMGQTGYMAPVMAGWLIPGVLLGGTLVVLGVIERRRRGVR
jgi:lipopolysaccharide export LptBFGC system permease protein LptF